jgi:hypothetical protein
MNNKNLFGGNDFKKSKMLTLIGKLNIEPWLLEKESD